MIIINSHDSHQDDRRTLTAWEQNIETAEIKHMLVSKDNVKLGGHSHPFIEKFMLVEGDAKIQTWNEKEGKMVRVLSAPQMIIFEPHEEHRLICSKGAIIIVFLLDKFSPKNIIPAKNI